MERVPLDSSAVRSAGYDEASHTLELEFTSGRIYQFDSVPPSVYQWLLRTSHKGSYVNRMINPRYPYRDVTSGPAISSTEDEELLQKLRDSVRWLDRNRKR